MIIDRFDHVLFYKEMLPGIEEGLKVLKELGESPAPGRYDFQGGWFTVMEGRTIPVESGEFEAHQKYVDVQVILEGEETVAWAPLSEVKAACEYDPDRDIQMFTGEAAQRNRIRAGMMWAAFPQDAHKPGRHEKEEQGYRKVVFKIPVKN